MASKEPIRVRTRTLPSGNKTVYLDIYINGKREYEYLKLYLIPEKNREDKEANKRKLQLAEAIKAKRIVDLQNGEFGFKTAYKEDTKFFDYYKALCEKRRGPETGKSNGNWGNWYSCLKHLEIYCKNKNITFADITPVWIEGFKNYLERDAKCWGSNYRKCLNDKPLSRNSRVSYFNKLKACMNQAFDDRIIAHNPIRGIESFQPEEGTRMYLTIEELKTLAQTECPYPGIKRAFLFSCLTGLRRSDILKMTWGEVVKQGEYTRIIFKQKKTGGQEYLDISPEAEFYMGERGKQKEQIFTDIHSPSVTNTAIKLWAAKAGIHKELTFHCGRHTFATMMLDLGTDIYTVSKLLGHRFLSTTQIYAKVIDKNKQAAVKLIPKLE